MCRPQLVKHHLDLFVTDRHLEHVALEDSAEDGRA